jgi:hypothetical protein
MWMKKSHTGSLVSTLRLGLCLSALGLVACIDPDSPLVEDSSEGCDEFVVGQDVDPNLEVDQTVKHFMQAASDFAQVGNDMEAAVLTACSNIAKDLGEADTWSSIENQEDKLTNASGTGACDVAGKKIQDMLIAAGPVEGTFAVAVSRGECHLDFEAQAKCDAECAANAVCDPGTVETRCEPGSLSVQCQANCEAGAWCIGKPEKPANCAGECEAACMGKCTGICLHKDGKKTENDAACLGKCSGKCEGKCEGKSKIDAPEGLNCGANVSCTGGCTGTYTDPVCVTEFKPPTCTVNTECHAACSATVAANAKCDPPIVDVYVDITTHPDLQPLVDTLRANLPALIAAADAQGKIALDAAHRLGDSGEVIANKIENLDGKSLACLGKSSSAVGTAVGKLDVSVQASVDVTVKVNDQTM